MEVDNKNIDRNRNYGIRNGDIVQFIVGGHVVTEGEVVELGIMDNNSVAVKCYKDGKIKSCVAEWCKILQRVEDR